MSWRVQFDILWPDITVREHLVLYAVIKGATWAEAGSVAEQAAAEVRLDRWAPAYLNALL
jgi:ABC-type multidrug transport system ATPase subunit